MNYDAQTCYDNRDCYEPEYECKTCKENESNMEDAKEFLTSIVKQLYSESYLDVAKFEDHLDSLCYVIGVKSNHGDINIKRKTSPLFDWAIELQKQCA